MPPRPTKLLDATLVPQHKRNRKNTLREFTARFIVMGPDNPKPTIREMSIYASCHTTAYRTAKRMCQDPKIFPGLTFARIPEKNIIAKNA